MLGFIIIEQDTRNQSLEQQLAYVRFFTSTASDRSGCNFATYSEFIAPISSHSRNDLVTREYFVRLLNRTSTIRDILLDIFESLTARRRAPIGSRDLNRGGDALSKETREKHCDDHVDAVGSFREQPRAKDKERKYRPVTVQTPVQRDRPANGDELRRPTKETSNPTTGPARLSIGPLSSRGGLSS